MRDLLIIVAIIVVITFLVTYARGYRYEFGKDGLEIWKVSRNRYTHIIRTKIFPKDREARKEAEAPKQKRRPMPAASAAEESLNIMRILRRSQCTPARR
ncbi:hypothetical protein OAA99_01190 [Omnitrophica bacterium]|nr:hypothetical protein [Candidatus Omnitrophota bacterium]